VDQIWSITPWLYSWVFLVHYFCTHDGAIHTRLAVLTMLTTAWGVRLTYNFWRKGGYGNLITHEEDYRWPILRKKMHPVLFLIFNLTFIATYQVFLKSFFCNCGISSHTYELTLACHQNVLLYWIALPAYYVMRGPVNEFNTYDFL
jgi:steroid 5-alpha reductase family enzyme